MLLKVEKLGIDQNNIKKVGIFMENKNYTVDEVKNFLLGLFEDNGISNKKILELKNIIYNVYGVNSFIQVKELNEYAKNLSSISVQFNKDNKLQSIYIGGNPYYNMYLNEDGLFFEDDDSRGTNKYTLISLKQNDNKN